MFFELNIIPLMLVGLEVILRVCAEVEDMRQVAADRGTNVTLSCNGYITLPNSNLLWIHRGNRTHHEILHDGSLFLTEVSPAHSGLYVCGLENDTTYSDRVNLTVRTEPPELVNVTVHASTILAVILWGVAGDGGYPIIDFTAQYRSAKPLHPNGTLEPWRPISPNHISPNSRQIDVYHLDCNASYWFRVWANNALGPSRPVEVKATTLFTDEDAELYKRFLADADRFDPRAWLAAVCVVMGALVILAAATCAVLARDCRNSDNEFDDQDVIELVPNIILNPGFVEGDAPPRSLAAEVIRTSERLGPGKPRRV